MTDDLPADLLDDAVVVPTIDLDSQQIKAIQLCCEVKHRIVGITGPAGSGKTTIMRYAASKLIDAGYRVAVCAPTGKAAKRIKEATGLNQATTIHMLLEYTHPGDPDPKTGKVSGISVPRRWMNNKLEADVIICDEYAMVSRNLHRNLIEAMPGGARLLAFGDVNQLPPIEEDAVMKGKPSPFQTLLAKFPDQVVHLEKIHRQGSGSGIVDNGKRILSGFTPMRKPDFEIVVTDDPTKVLGLLVRDAHKAGIDFSSLDHQIISPSKKSFCGTLALNGMMQQIYERTDTPRLLLERQPWDKSDPIAIRVGTKVIQTKNDYNLGIYNGETGIVKEINPEFGVFVVDFGDRAVEIPPSVAYEDFDAVGQTTVQKYYNPQRSIELAYVLTTHKCQGSEYKHVIYIMNKSMFSLQIRPNLYTGVTRAREHVTLLTDGRSMQSALKRTESMF